MISESQWTSTERGPPGSHDHSKIHIFRSVHHLFFERARCLVDHRKNQSIPEISFISCRRFGRLQVTELMVDLSIVAGTMIVKALPRFPPKPSFRDHLFER